MHTNDVHFVELHQSIIPILSGKNYGNQSNYCDPRETTEYYNFFWSDMISVFFPPTFSPISKNTQ